ncbi:hypothetical protein ACFIJ5_09385 [Haloimpatiens sp. FM7330]|uniref:hypothetical protein n=1 Tax=Haloimpatiens sp. FM7330 TaxID=3298610 RepID=UPI00363FB32C
MNDLKSYIKFQYKLLRPVLGGSFFITTLLPFVVLITVIFISLMYSISILVASINKLTILLLIVCNTVMNIISDVIFNEALVNYYYYIIAVIFILLVVVTLKISWTVLKKKVDIRSSFFQKWCENFSPNCEK